MFRPLKSPPTTLDILFHYLQNSYNLYLFIIHHDISKVEQCDLSQTSAEAASIRQSLTAAWSAIAVIQRENNTPQAGLKSFRGRRTSKCDEIPAEQGSTA